MGGYFVFRNNYSKVSDHSGKNNFAGSTGKVKKMDIKGKIDEIVAKVKNDKEFAAKFKNDPIKAVESVIGVDLPDDKIKSVVEGVKAKISVEKAGGAIGSMKNLFK